MTDEETTSLNAEHQHQKTILFLRVIRIVDQTSVLIEKHSLGLFERNSMLDQIGSGIRPVPGEVDIAHRIILALCTGLSQRYKLKTSIANAKVI